MSAEHPKDFDECVKRDIYERDLNELKKDLESVRDAIGRKKEELQKEIDYKAHNNKQLTVWASGISIGISAYLFTQINEIRNVLADHVQKLGHIGMDQRVSEVEQQLTSLMCATFNALC